MDERRVKVWLQIVLGGALTVLFFFMMAPFVVAILLGAIVAIICYPLYEKLTIKLPRGLSALIVTAGVAIGILLPLLSALYAGAFQLFRVVSRLPFLKDGTTIESPADITWASPAINFISRYLPVDQEWIQTQALELIKNIAQKVSAAVAHSLAGMPGLLLGFIVVILSIYFFLVDGDRFLRFLANLSPLPYEKSVELYHTFEESCRGVVVGLFLGAFAQAVVITLLFWITGLPNPPLVGALSLALGMVPMVGTGPVWIGAALYLFIGKGSIFLGIIMVAGGLLVSLSDNVIRSWILAGAGQMHPFLALISVFGALNLLGAAGIFLGPIIAAVFLSFIKILTSGFAASPNFRTPVRPNPISE